MANNKSAKKRIQIAKRNCLENKYYKTSVRTLTKKFFIALDTYKLSKIQTNKEQLAQTLNLLYSFLDKGTKRNVFHKNYAARQKSKLASYFKNL